MISVAGDQTTGWDRSLPCATMTAEVDQQLRAARELLWAGDVDRARATLDALIETHGDPTALSLRGLVN